MLKIYLKKISPDLLKILAEIDHGDVLFIADGNFPSKNFDKRVIRYDGNNIPELLEQILTLFPLDTYVQEQVFLMGVTPGDNYEPTIWSTYEDILRDSGEQFQIKYLDRFGFYDQSKSAYAIIATSEEALYANIILKKGGSKILIATPWAYNY